MPLNSTQSERRKQAARDLAEKMKLERRLISELKEFYTVMANDLRAFFSQTGNVPRADIYADDLRGILTRHYRRTALAFSGNITDFLQNVDEDEEIAQELIAIAALAGITLQELVGQLDNTVQIQQQSFITANVSEDVRNITRTNQKDLDSSVALATATLLSTLERQPSRNEIAVAASRDFKKTTFTRSETIAVTVTQKASEGTKEIEREVFFDRRNDLGSRAQLGLQPLEEVVIWMTIGDERVRESHIVADGQERGEIEPGVFLVQDERLKFPGDPIGSPSNVINCRCSAVTQIG